MAFTLNPYNLYDSWYDERVRQTLSMFHIHLSHGKYAANGPMTSLDLDWNRNGAFSIGRHNFVTTLEGFNTTFHGLQAPDRYHVVDGNVGAVLYHLQGPQTGVFEGLEPSGRQIDIMGAELMNFDADVKLHYLITVEELGLAIEQLNGSKPVHSPSNVALFDNPQTSPDYRQTLRDNMALLYTSFNKKEYAKIGLLAASNVQVNADQTVSSGRDAFLQLFTSDQKSFPGKVFHVDFVLADGHLGAVEWVWEGTQTAAYTTVAGKVIQPTNNAARVRGFLFMEFNDDALISKATLVHNEAVVEQQLFEAQNKVLYPLYP